MYFKTVKHTLEMLKIIEPKRFRFLQSFLRNSKSHSSKLNFAGIKFFKAIFKLSIWFGLF